MSGSIKCRDCGGTGRYVSMLVDEKCRECLGAGSFPVIECKVEPDGTWREMLPTDPKTIKDCMRGGYDAILRWFEKQKLLGQPQGLGPRTLQDYARGGLVPQGRPVKHFVHDEFIVSGADSKEFQKAMDKMMENARGLIARRIAEDKQSRPTYRVDRMFWGDKEL